MSLVAFALILTALIAGFILGFKLHDRLPPWLLYWMGAREDLQTVNGLLAVHFEGTRLDRLSISEKRFPFRMRADLQRGIDDAIGRFGDVEQFYGVQLESSYQDLTFGALMNPGYTTAHAVAPQYEEVDIGEDEPVRTVKNGLWFLRRDGVRLALLLSPHQRHGQITGWAIQVASPTPEAAAAIADPFLKEFERAVTRSTSYRGKILSLEDAGEAYSGQVTGIKVHKLRDVARDQVILPGSTLELMERNVVQFVTHRKRLVELGQPTKKGVLFYGPPGTGKTHTIHYLTRALAGHTTLLITAEQVGHLGEYMILARLLAPSIVVMEDVDLIARNRTRMGSACEEVLLNKLLNEMDGLREQADILFILTTNRPEELEAALSSRPGRIDQAIEFPLPDDEGRRKLIALYAGSIEVAPADVEEITRRTEKVSAAFIKELMRRAVQFHVARAAIGPLALEDVERALDELLVSGGSLNLKLLGACRG